MLIFWPRLHLYIPVNFSLDSLLIPSTWIEIRDYIEAYRAMHVSTDGRRVYNPTVTDLYFCENEKNYKIAPGETVVID